MKKVELLAPAGSVETMKAVVNAGCDAVYIGGSLFGARAYAENAENEKLLKAIDWIHLHNKKLYLTVNTLLKERELRDELVPFLLPLYQQGLDAVIVQDFGVLAVLTEVMPKLPIHLSTQMTINTGNGVEVLRRCLPNAHITRFVPSRELSLSEIRTMRNETKLEIETFIHGALCYSYSGQCLMSSLIGGRSGNRGRCAQPCRMEYQFQEGKRTVLSEGSYLLSPKDMCSLSILPELMESGIDSFKIEGRMKKLEYACGVTEGYRRVMDRYYELGAEKYREFTEENPHFLSDIQERFLDLYNRGGFSHGYYDCGGGPQMMSIRRQNHNGVYVGKVSRIRGINACIEVQVDVNPQDVIEFRFKDEKVYECTVGETVKKGGLFYTNFLPGSNVNLNCDCYRTKNAHLMKELSDKYLGGTNRIEVSGKLYLTPGEMSRLEVDNGRISCCVTGDVVEQAANQPLTEERLREQMLKTNATEFMFSNLEIFLGGKVFLPVSRLNDLRRRALDVFADAVIAEFHREVPEDTCTGYDKFHVNSKQKTDEEDISDDVPILQVLVSSEAQAQEVCRFESFRDVYVDMTDLEGNQLRELLRLLKEAGKTCYLAFPRILRKTGEQQLAETVKDWNVPEVAGFMVRNPEAVRLITDVCGLHTETPGYQLISDYNLYATNSYAVHFLQAMGITKITAPLELTYRELSEYGHGNLILPVYGKMPFMVTAQCPVRTVMGCRHKSGRTFSLIDRMKKKLPVMTHCNYCYATIHNSETYSLSGCRKEIEQIAPYAVRLDFTTEAAEETNRVLQQFELEYLRGENPEKSFLFGQTKGNFIRGTEMKNLLTKV